MYQMEEMNIILDQVGNGFTEQQMKRHMHMKLATQGYYHKILLLLEKEKVEEIDTWKKHKEFILKWYSKILQFEITGSQAGSAYNATESSDPAQLKKEGEKETMTQNMLLAMNKKLDTMDATFSMLELQQQNDYVPTAPQKEQSKEEQYFAYLLEQE